MQATENSYNAQEAAERLGVHPQTVYGWLRRGKLEADKAGGEWKIRAAELDRIASGWQASLTEAATCQEAADFLERWARQRQAEAVAATVAAARRLVAASENLGRAEHGAEAAILERLDDVISKLADIRSALDTFDRLQDLWPLHRDLQAEARAGEREVSERLNAEMKRRREKQ